MIDVLSVLVPLYLLLGLGLVAGRLRPFDGASRPLNSYVYYLAMPAFLFIAVVEAPEGTELPVTFWLVALVVTLLFSAVIFPIVKRGRHPENAAKVSMAAANGNVGYFGLPVILGALGPQAGLPSAVALLIHQLIYFIGYPIYHSIIGKTDVRQVVLRSSVYNPAVVAVVAAFFFRLTGLGVPVLALSSVQLLAQTTIPVALVALGLALRPAISMLGRGGTPWGAVAWSTAIKLVLLPLLTWGVALLVVPDPTGLLIPVLVLMAAMPTAVAAFTLSMEYDQNSDLIAVIVAVSTLGALVTLPAFIVLLQ